VTRTEKGEGRKGRREKGEKGEGKREKREKGEGRREKEKREKGEGRGVVRKTFVVESFQKEISDRRRAYETLKS
jgi:hypothetical protein